MQLIGKSEKQAFLASLPLVLGAAPLGMIFGALVVASGLPAWFAVMMSLVVFAGSAQFIVIGLMATGTPLFVILLTTFVVNLRHALYGVALMPHLKSEPLWMRALLAFGLTDESFAVAAAKFEEENVSIKRYLGASIVFFYSSWVAFTYLGVVLGEQFPALKDMGLEIAMLVTFIGMTVPHMKKKPALLAILITALSSLLFSALPYNLGLIFSTALGVSGGYLSSRYKRKAGVLAYE